MTEVFYDSWAWVEVYAGTTAGARLDAAYGEGRADVHASAWAVAEVGAVTHAAAGEEAASAVLRRVERDAVKVHAVTVDDARGGALLRAELRAKSGRKADLGDAVMLFQARRLRMRLISGDAAFDGQPDVRAT